MATRISLCTGLTEARFDVVAIGASLGGITAIGDVLSALPTYLPCAVLVVQHRCAENRGALLSALQRRSALLVHEPCEGEPVQPGSVLLAPNDFHMSVTPERTIALTKAAKVKYVRPSIDVMFRSVAAAYGSRSIAVVLSGRQDDGAAGICAIKGSGGRVLVQDASTSFSFDMPRNAIATGCVDFVLPLSRMAPAIVTLAMVHGAAELFRVPLPPWVEVATGEAPDSASA